MLQKAFYVQHYIYTLETEIKLRRSVHRVCFIDEYSLFEDNSTLYRQPVKIPCP